MARRFRRLAHRGARLLGPRPIPLSPDGHAMALWVCGFWLYVGWGFAAGPDKWRSSTSYYVLVHYGRLPLRAWGGIFLLVGIAQLVAILLAGERRLPLVLGATIAGTWAASFATAALVGRLTGAAGPATWALIAVNQLILAGYPRRRWHPWRVWRSRQ